MRTIPSKSSTPRNPSPRSLRPCRWPASFARIARRAVLAKVEERYPWSVRVLGFDDLLRDRSHPRRQLGHDRRQISLGVRVQALLDPGRMLRHVRAALEIT